MKIFITTSLILFITAKTMAHVPPPCSLKIPIIDIPMRQAIKTQLGIDEGSLNLQKTEIEIISQTKVSVPLALQLAKRDQLVISNSGFSDEGWADYYNIYVAGNVENLIIKYSFYNKQGKKNVFIGSTINNDGNCYVSFGGYITVSREF